MHPPSATGLGANVRGTTRFQGGPNASGSDSRSPQRGIPDGFKFGSGLPFGHVRIIGDAVSDEEVELAIFDGAGQVPVRLNLVGGLVIPFGGIFSALFKPPSVGLADEIHTLIRIEGGNAIFGKLEMVGAIVKAFLGFGIELNDAVLFVRRSINYIVQRGSAAADLHDVPRAA